MQFEISDDAAAVFAQEFYMALAGGYPVDAALAEGRRAIFATKTNAEWGIPVLFMRAADGRIFDVQAPVVRSASSPPVTPAPVAESVSPPPVVESPVIQQKNQPSSAGDAPTISVAPPTTGSEEAMPASTVQIGTSVEWNKTISPTGSTPNDLRMVKIIGGVILGAFVVLALMFYFIFRNTTEQATPAALLPPTVSFFRAEPSQIVEGENQSVQLIWSVSGEMTDVAVTGPGIDASLALSRTGSLLVSLDKPATFALTARNFDQPTTQQVTISAASPTSAPVGGASTPATGSVDVTVTFNSVRIIDDCDTVLTGLGEFWLDLTVNDQHLRWPEKGTNEVNSGQSYAIGQSLTARVADGEQLVITGAGFEVDEFQTESMGSIRVAHSATDGWGVGSDSQASLAVCTFVLGFVIEGAPVSAQNGGGDISLTPSSLALDPILTPSPTPAEPVAGATRIIDDITFVYMPAGEFMMGSDEDGIDLALQKCDQYENNNCQRDRFSDESPQHLVYIDALWLMQTEVTNTEYQEFIQANGYLTERYWTLEGWRWRNQYSVTSPSLWTDNRYNRADYPVVGVSWYEAVAYANWLSEHSGLNIRLPSEAEWEKGARGIDSRIYPWGSDWDGGHLNYCDVMCTETQKDESHEDGYRYTAPVGQYVSGVSPYGAYDMAGNVWEWTQDWYRNDYYAVSPALNPRGPSSGEGRVTRGGAWLSYPTFVRTTHRLRYASDYRSPSIGFRLVVPGS